MSRVVLNSNIASLGVLRRLGQATEDLSKSFERLSSGLRINRASDDPAGLAISSSLNVDSRVYGQAVRNVSDGISLLSIAESAGSELTSLLTRMRELATQSANGTLSVTQRRSLDQEARALTEEYNRILSSTSFNNLSLLAGSLDVGIQPGYGSENALSIALGDALERSVGDGTYESTVSSVASGINSITADFNSDGVDDLLTTDFVSGTAIISISNGDGTFTGTQTILPPTSYLGAEVDDFNGDGKLDLVLRDASLGAEIFLGNGDGTFTLDGNAVGLAATTAYETGDYNGDGIVDIVAGDAGFLNVAFGNGDGSFQNAVSYAMTGSHGDTIENADVNGDGVLDLIVGATTGNGDIAVMLGNGDGTFTEHDIVRTGSTGGGVSVLDANHDGFDDVISSSNNGTQLFLSNGDGSFTASSSLSSNDGVLAQAADLNGDGLLDIVEYGTSVTHFIANADGTFEDGVVIGAGGGGWGTVGDFDNDGGADIFVNKIGFGDLYLANTEQTTSLKYVDLLSQEKARQSFSVIDEAMDSLLVELGNIGAFTSRLATANSNLALSRDNLSEAASRIADADIAEEAANLAKTQILQQAGAAILAQANSLPSLALRLLDI